MVSFLNPNPEDDDDEDINSDEGELHVTDLYEYDEPIPEEESRKNQRYDPVENVHYELPSDFEVNLVKKRFGFILNKNGRTNNWAFDLKKLHGLGLATVTGMDRMVRDKICENWSEIGIGIKTR